MFLRCKEDRKKDRVSLIPASSASATLPCNAFFLLSLGAEGLAAAAAMDRAPGGVLDTTMRLLLRRNSVYVAFILTGALVGERVVDYGINKVWSRNNVGKRFEDIPKLGSKVEGS